MKERLTGAIILVALIVLLVPELLTGPLRSKPAGTKSRAADAPALSTEIPSAKARPPLRTYTLTLGPSAPASRIAAPVSPPDRTAQAPQTVPIAAAAAPAPAPTSGSGAPPRAAARIVPPPKPAAHGGSSVRTRALARQPTPVRVARRPAPTGAPARRAPRVSARWVVQLASFADHGNALRLTRRLRMRHLPATVAPLRLKGRMWWRVWVGPVSSRASAAQLAQRLRPIARGEVLRE